jgi:hypothetical protein
MQSADHVHERGNKDDRKQSGQPSLLTYHTLTDDAFLTVTQKIHQKPVSANQIVL